jgi:hypothetical protein
MRVQQSDPFKDASDTLVNIAPLATKSSLLQPAHAALAPLGYIKKQLVQGNLAPD